MGKREIQKQLVDLLGERGLTDGILRLLDERARNLAGRDIAIQNPDLLKALEDTLNLEHPISGLNLSDIGMAVIVGDATSSGIPFAIRRTANFSAGVSTLSTFWWNIKSGGLFTADGAQNTLTGTVYNTFPNILDLARFDSLAIDINTGQPATNAPISLQLQDGGPSHTTQGAAPPTITDGIPIMLARTGTRQTNVRMNFPGPWFAPGSWELVLLCNNTQVLAGGGTTITVSATGFIGADGAYLGYGGGARPVFYAPSS